MVLQDRPLLQWQDDVKQCLDELLQLEGRGDFVASACPCGVQNQLLFRCDDCFDCHLHCQSCMVNYHARHPFHRIRLWNNRYFSQVTLKSLGHRVQLGHEPGDVCPSPKPAFADDFVVLDLAGIFELGVDFCGCSHALPHHIQIMRARWYPATTINPRTAASQRLLRHFHVLSTQSKISGWEFYTSLSRITDNTGIQTPKDRYLAFMRMVREWHHLKMVKRGGGRHGIKASPGCYAVQCPACPQPEKNLPKGWENAPGKKGWIYRLYLAIDANFRLRRKNVSSDTADPSLNRGIAFMVEESEYQRHLSTFDKQHVEKSDHCNNHDAVKLASLKSHTGLAATGLTTVDCARHDMKRPCSSGDLCYDNAGLELSSLQPPGYK
ncbi:hypothetical protein C8Q79DRAFT_904587 [Trametes meyenii]|nr:hypothetical protein C8Q79DRAFT_904587 [Trametes meyenii]